MRSQIRTVAGERADKQIGFRRMECALGYGLDRAGGRQTLS